MTYDTETNSWVTTGGHSLRDHEEALLVEAVEGTMMYQVWLLHQRVLDVLYVVAGRLPLGPRLLMLRWMTRHLTADPVLEVLRLNRKHGDYQPTEGSPNEC